MNEILLRVFVASLIAQEITPKQVADTLIEKPVDIDTYLSEVQTEVANHPSVQP